MHVFTQKFDVTQEKVDPNGRVSLPVNVFRSPLFPGPGERGSRVRSDAETKSNRDGLWYHDCETAEQQTLFKRKGFRYAHYPIRRNFRTDKFSRTSDLFSRTLHKHQNSVLIFAQFRANVLLTQHFCTRLFQNSRR